MNNPTEVRRTLTRISNMVLNQEIEPRQANSIILAANAILNSCRIDEQQKQITELAAILEQVTAEDNNS